MCITNIYTVYVLCNIVSFNVGYIKMIMNVCSCTGMCDLLIESTCFCQLEDYICLAGQLDDAYDTVKTEVVETVNFLMSGSSKSNAIPAQLHLPDLVHHPKTSTVKQVSEIVIILNIKSFNTLH